MLLFVVALLQRKPSITCANRVKLKLQEIEQETGRRLKAVQVCPGGELRRAQSSTLSAGQSHARCQSED
jgi:hypothetical protein